MPNINLQEKDLSTFADQQFISIAYNGKTNEVSGNAKVLAYRVTFVSDNKDYCIVEVGENQKVNIPTPPTKEGYTFKQWLLNGEAFDFSTVITSDILLIAEFEEAPPVEYTTLSTVNNYETSVDPYFGNYFRADFDSVEIYNQFMQEVMPLIQAGDTDKVQFKVSFDGVVFEKGVGAAGIGNASLNPSTGISEDTGEDYFATPYDGFWFISCRNTGAHTFGLAYRIAEAPAPSAE